MQLDTTVMTVTTLITWHTGCYNCCFVAKLHFTVCTSRSTTLTPAVYAVLDMSQSDLIRVSRKVIPTATLNSDFVTPSLQHTPRIPYVFCLPWPVFIHQHCWRQEAEMTMYLPIQPQMTVGHWFAMTYDPCDQLTYDPVHWTSHEHTT